ncbi:MAG: Coenzyme F420 hydrogenase/dehydrogenase, beta subunit C-terminal domain [Promethearchaeota archaeon]
MIDDSNNEPQPKSFDDLIKEVHEKGICGECGGCVSFCSAHELEAIEMPPEGGPPRYKNKDACMHDGICYLICPQIHALDSELNDRYKYKPPIGNWIKVASSRASSETIRQNATDGGTVTAILTSLLDKNLIDGAIVSRAVAPFKRVPFLATTKEDLLAAAGTHFDISGGVVTLEKYNTFISTVSSLRKYMDSDLVNIAVVGTPCQIHSIRKMQLLNILPAHVVKYTIGLFCNWNFSFDKMKRQELEDKFSFSFDDVDKMNIRDGLSLHMKNNETIELSFDDVKHVARPACFACPDFSNVYADLSFGGLGSKQGFTSSIIRTEKGKEIYQLALKDKYIEEPIELNTSVKKSELLAKIISFSRMKIKRSADFFKNA